MLRSLALATAVATWLHCSSTSPAVVGGVRVLSNVDEAILFVDDLEHGPVDAYADHYLRLVPGRHSLRLEHPGYRPEHLDIVVARDIALSVTLDLQRLEAPQESSDEQERR